MRYLKKFNEADEKPSEFKDADFYLREFNGKKSTMDSIYSNDDRTDAQIESDILNKVFGGKKESTNPLLSRYSNILKMNRRLRRMEKETQDDIKRKDDINSDIKNLKSDSSKYPESSSYYTKEISKLQASIKDIDRRISDRKNDVSKIQKLLQRETVDFKSSIVDFRNSLKKLF